MIIYNEVEGGGAISPVDAPQELRAKEARDAAAWYTAITAEVFG